MLFGIGVLQREGKIKAVAVVGKITGQPFGQGERVGRVAVCDKIHLVPARQRCQRGIVDLKACPVGVVGIRIDDTGLQQVGGGGGQPRNAGVALGQAVVVDAGRGKFCHIELHGDIALGGKAAVSPPGKDRRDGGAGKLVGAAGRCALLGLAGQVAFLRAGHIEGHRAQYAARTGGIGHINGFFKGDAGIAGGQPVGGKCRGGQRPRQQGRRKNCRKLLSVHK